MSLVSGITFGGLLAYGAYQTSANPKNFIFLFGKVCTFELENSSIVKLYAIAHIYCYTHRCKFSPVSFDGLSLL